MTIIILVVFNMFFIFLSMSIDVSVSMSDSACQLSLICLAVCHLSPSDYDMRVCNSCVF